MADWELSLGYDYRFGMVGFQLHKDESGEEATFAVSLRDLLTHLQVKPHELQAVMQPEYQGTEGGQDIELARRRLLEETDWEGKACLDLAGYAGFAAKIAVAKGAISAKVVDSEQWRIYGWPQPTPIEGVEFIKSNLYDWTEPADVVIFYNCLYHVADPMRALAHVRTLTKREMLLCTLVRYHDGPWVYIYNPRECNETDPSVYTGPSIEALERMLALTGWQFERYALAFDRVLYRCKPIPDFVDAETQEVRRVSAVPQEATPCL